MFWWGNFNLLWFADILGNFEYAMKSYYFRDQVYDSTIALAVRPSIATIGGGTCNCYCYYCCYSVTPSCCGASASVAVACGTRPAVAASGATVSRFATSVANCGKSMAECPFSPAVTACKSVSGTEAKQSTPTGCR